MSSRRGQVAIILIFIIAVGLIFYAVSLNVGRVSTHKIMATQASNLMAATYASYMASYGEQVFQEQLDGKEEICEKTAVFQAVLLVVIFVVIVFAAAAVAGMINSVLGASVATPATVATAAAVSAVAAGVSAVIQATVVQPAITEAWNSIIWENMSIVDQFMEAGIQTGLKNAVSDRVELPDVIDLDADGIFLDPANPHDADNAADYVSRFGWYYMERVKNAPPPPSLGDFHGCLCTLLYVDDSICEEEYDIRLASLPEKCHSPEWGIFDPVKGRQIDGTWASCGARNDIWDGSHVCCPYPEDRLLSGRQDTRQLSNHFRFPARCDPCCQPEWLPCPMAGLKDWVFCKVKCDVEEDPHCTLTAPVFCAPTADQCGNGDFELAEPVRLAPECCYASGDDKCGQPDTCNERSYLLETQQSGTDYDYVFDRHYEDSDNNDWDPPIISFREAVGLDDFHSDYLVQYGFYLNSGNPLNNRYAPDWHRFGGHNSSYRDSHQLSLEYYTAIFDEDRLYAMSPPRDIYQTFREGDGGLFTIRDTSGFYRPLIASEDDDFEGPDIYDEYPDKKRGIFGFLYKMADWGIDLTKLTYGNDTPADNSESYILPWPHKDDYQCYWCDLGRVGQPLQSPFYMDCPRDHYDMLDHIDELTDEDFRVRMTYPPSGDIDVGAGPEPIFPGYDPFDEDQQYYWCVDRVNPQVFENLGSTIVADSVLNLPNYTASPPDDEFPDDIYDLLFYEYGEPLPWWRFAPPSAPGVYPIFNELPYHNPETCAIPNGGWRRGLDIFCDTLYPYYEGCDKHGGYHQCEYNRYTDFYSSQDPRPEDDPTVGIVYDVGQADCPCPDATVEIENPANAGVPPEDFPDDRLDVMILQMDAFIDWAEELLATPLKRLRQSMTLWYDEAADWIEPGCLKCDLDDDTGEDLGCSDCWSDNKAENCCCHPQNDRACPGSFTHKQRIGKLWEWRDTIRFYRNPLAAWLTRTYENKDKDVWCVPEEGDPCSPQDERETRNADEDEVDGDIDDVLACLKWQVEDEMESWCGAVPLDGEAVGNAEKFQACRVACERDAASGGRYNDFVLCYDLPRSLDPGRTKDEGVCIRRDEDNVPDPHNTDMFEPPFNERLWELCEYQVTTDIPSDLLDIPAWLRACSSACSRLNYCPYRKGGFWPEDSYFDVPCRRLLNIYIPPITTAAQADFWRQQVQDALDYCQRVGQDWYGSCDDPAFDSDLDDIIDYLDDGLNSCDPDETRNPFMRHLRNSEKWAYGQVDKYKYRAWFLGNRLAEGKNVFQTFNDAYVQLTEFLIGYHVTGGELKEDPFLPSDLGGDALMGTTEDDVIYGRDDWVGLNPGDDGRFYTEDDVLGDDDMAPAEQLIWSRSNLDKEPRQMASVAIYVWQDEQIASDRPPRSVDESGVEDRRGYVHAVKVEGRIPKRCNYECGATRWPYVKTEEHTMERCYVLDATRGMVKARVIRYDENPGLAQNPRFPGGTTIWSPHFGHPHGRAEQAGDAANVFNGPCNWPKTSIPLLKRYGWADQSAWDGTVERKRLGHAIMLNHVPDLGSDEIEEDMYWMCWGNVHNLLEQGMASETCAEYFFGRGQEGSIFHRFFRWLTGNRISGTSIFDKKGFKLRFIECDDRFLRGIN